MVEVLGPLLPDLAEPVAETLLHLVVALGVHQSQEPVVVVVDVQLEWVLVVREQGVVPVGQVGQSSAQVEGVLDGRLVVHRSEEVVLQCQDADLLQHLITHHELLGGSGDVPIAVLNSHSGESSLLDLESDTPGKVHGNLGLLSGVDSGVSGSSEDVKSLVSNLIHHFVTIKFIYI